MTMADHFLESLAPELLHDYELAALESSRAYGRLQLLP
jgi:hypothetical protein